MYSRKVGEPCKQDADCENLDGYVSCSSGVCSKPDLYHLGEGCGSDSECGRDLQCECPNYGDTNGGRSRCVVPGIGQSLDLQAYADYQIGSRSKYKQLISCTTQKKCIPFIPTQESGQYLSFQFLFTDVIASNCVKTQCGKQLNNLRNHIKAFLKSVGRRPEDGRIQDICTAVSTSRSASAKYEGVEYSANGNTRSMSCYITIILSLVLSLLSQW